MSANASQQERKKSVRRELAERRRLMNEDELERQNSAIIRHVLELLRSRPEPNLQVAAYSASEREPGGAGLVPALAEAGFPILLPISGDKGQLSWAKYRGPEDTTPGRLGISEPTGERFGTEAVAANSVILVPALGVTSQGVRMGKGGGYYDRTLAELPDSGPLTVVLLFDDEITDSIPVEDHDMGVDAAITPKGLLSFPGNASD